MFSYAISLACRSNVVHLHSKLNLKPSGMHIALRASLCTKRQSEREREREGEKERDKEREGAR